MKPLFHEDSGDSVVFEDSLDSGDSNDSSTPPPPPEYPPPPIPLLPESQALIIPIPEKQKVLDAFGIVIDLLNDLGLDYWISDGTLLGWFRNGAMLLHDSNTNLSIMETDLSRIWKSRKTISTRNTDLIIKRNRNRKTLHVQSQNYPGFNLVTIYTFRLTESGFRNNCAVRCMSLKLYPFKWIYPLGKSTFASKKIKVPHFPREVLEERYGYIGPCAVWDEISQCYTRPKSLASPKE